MTRPESHQEQLPVSRCGNCVHGHVPEYKYHRLCFYGDNYTASRSHLREYWSEVVLDGRDLCCVEGQDFDEVWAGRVVEDTDVCDFWCGREGEA